jgi:hypothetical protein
MKKLLEWYGQYVEKYVPFRMHGGEWPLSLVDGYIGCAQFLVHRDLILNFPKSMYQDMYDWIIEKDVVLPKECEYNQRIIAAIS